MTFINKSINTVTLTNTALVVLSFVLISDLPFQLKEFRDEAIVLGSCRQGNWRFLDKLQHVSNGDRYGGEVVKLDEI